MTNITTIPKSRKNVIKYFIFVMFIIPTIQVSGLTTVIGRFIPNLLGYNLLAFILSIPLLRSLRKDYGNLKWVVFAIAILTLYILFTFISTTNDTSFFEALTVFRHSFMQVLNLFIILPFMFSLNKEEVNYALHCIFKCLIAFLFVYLSNNLIYDWLGVKGAIETYGGISVDRSIIGVPQLVPVWVALFLVYAILNVKNARIYLMVALFTIIITFTRNMLFSTMVIVAIVIILMVVKNPPKIGNGIKMLLFALFGIIFLSIFLPDAINFWMAKLSNTFNEDLKHDVGTFAFRERLIEDALYAIRHNTLLGLGYVRDVAKGEYSLVMGTDTYIAPILWCEGWGGLILRILPFAILGLNALTNLFVKKKDYWLDIVIVAIIVASTINYVQTDILTNYPLTLGIIILLKIKDNYNRKTQDLENISII